MSILCSLVGASFTVAAAAEVLRSKKAITAVGNAQVSTAQSKFGGASALLDGSGDGIQIDHNGEMRFGTANFTIEFWYRPIARTQQYPVVFSNRNGFAAGNIVFHDRHDANQSKLTVWIYNLSAASPIFTATTTTVNNTWYHIALSRSGTSLRFFVNGTQEGSTYTTSADIDTGAGSGLYYLSFPGSSSEYNGYIEEVRISNSARYTANFSVATSAFVNDANTLFLMHANGTNASTFFEDDNGVRAQAGIYRENGPTISTTQSKFGGSSLYFPETSGQSINAVYDPIAMGLTNNGDFTVELWAYWTKLPSSGDTGYMMFYSHSPEPYILMQNGGVYLGAGGYPSFATTFTTNTWYHIAVSRSSGNLRCFVNGTQIGSTVTGSTYNYIPYTNGLSTRFGKFGDDRGRWQGYMDEIRFSKTARYTANFTAPTEPFVNDSNTLLLIHGDGTNASTVFVDDNGGYQNVPPTSRFADDPFTKLLLHFEGTNGYQGSISDDNSSGRTAITGLNVGDSGSIRTSDYKFGNSSIGSLGIPGGWGTASASALSPNLNDFTIEFWCRPVATANSDVLILGGAANGTAYMALNADTGSIQFGRANVSWDVQYLPGVALSTVWHHIAIVKTAGFLKIYQDGVQVASQANSSTFTYDSIAMNMGGITPSSYFLVDEFRISHIARYTAPFTVA